MKFLFKLFFLSLVFCIPCYAGLGMKNPIPMFWFAWACLGFAIWVLGYRRRKREERWYRDWQYFREMQQRRYR